MKGAIVSIDAIATNPTIAGAIRAKGADCLLAVKANQTTLRSETESVFASADPEALDKGHGRIEERSVSVAKDVGWRAGGRRFPGELRLPDVATLVRVSARTELKDRGRFETRFYVLSAVLDATKVARAVRGHTTLVCVPICWTVRKHPVGRRVIENRLHWVLDVTFSDGQSRLRRGHGARNMAPGTRPALRPRSRARCTWQEKPEAAPKTRRLERR